MGNEKVIARIEAIGKSDQVPGSVQKVAVPICPEEVPAVQTGECTYYQNRHNSFVERQTHRKNKPPTYYLEYGFKYCSKFKKETYAKLSKEGQIWLDGTLLLLQEFMEQGLVQKNYVSGTNEAFNANYQFTKKDGTIDMEQVTKFYTGIECREAHFKHFAFATHPDAYRPKIMETLPFMDLAHIGLTPNFSEIRDPLTREQIGIMWEKMDISMTVFGVR